MAEVTILQVVPRLDTGGSEQATVEITEALTRAGARALVATEGGRMATAIIFPWRARTRSLFSPMPAGSSI